MPFIDIFSKTKKKQKEEKNLTIIADYREKNSLVISELIEKNIKILFKQLPVADFLIKGTAIERKTISDFQNSMINKRLMKQLEELKQYPKRLLIIEGIDEKEIYNDEPGGINGNAIRGFLLSIVLEFKVPIILTKDYRDTAKFLFILTKKKTKEHISLRARKKSLTPKEQLIYLLEGFPNIGPATAKKLLKHFKTFKKIINAKEENLKKIIGKKSETLSRLINKKY